MFSIKYPLSPPEMSPQNGHKKQVIASGPFWFFLIMGSGCVMRGPGRSIMCYHMGGETYVPVDGVLSCLTLLLLGRLAAITAAVCVLDTVSSESPCRRALPWSTVQPTTMVCKLCLLECRGPGSRPRGPCWCHE